MNLKRLRWVLRRLWFFHFHINLKHRLNRGMEEKGIVAVGRLPDFHRSSAAGLPELSSAVPPGGRQTILGNNPVLLHVAVQSGLQGVKAKVNFPRFLLHHGRDNPHHESLLVVETSENPTQSFHNIIRRRTHLLNLVLYMILYRYLYM